MRKDNVDLICNIGELAGLFERSTSLESFLQTVVSVVAYHMRAAVCSVYLYDEEKQELVLTANQGFHAESIGNVRLKLGEGLVGVALKELRPIREGTAFRNPFFKLIPGINEENYQAFLAVPIMRGLARVGVLVVQDPVQDYFGDNDTKALQAIAAQLAATIENAKLLMKIHHMKEEAAQKASVVDQDNKFIHGLPVSSGVAWGKATVSGTMDDTFVLDEESKGLFCTLEDFQRALINTERQLEQLQTQMEERLADVASLIFSAHLLMIKDTNFSGEILRQIKDGYSPQQAIANVITEYIHLFASSPNPHLREKVQDVKDLGRRLLQNLFVREESVVDYRGHVILAGELLPSDIVKLAAQNIEGLLMIGGGINSHISILARSLQIPMVIVNDNTLFTRAVDKIILIDGEQGTVYIEPSDDVLNNYQHLIETRRLADETAAHIPDQALTTDGHPIQILANINMLSELAIAKRLKAAGVGLYRSEFPFIVRNTFPSEEEQYRIYRKIIDEMSGKPIVFRTLDIGGDKILSYYPTGNETNPFLGLRAIRFSLQNKDIFSHQLRALLRAGHDTPLRIMFPLISSVDDFLEAKEVVQSCILQLASENIPHQAHPQLGIMIELPSAVEIIDELLTEVDFVSIGTNDLIQYYLAVDRTNEQISHLYLSHHPAILRALKRISDAARKAGKSLSLCGEMAADPTMIPFLLGIGIHALSMEVRSMPRVYQTIAKTNLQESCVLAEKILRLKRISEIEKLLGPTART